MRSTPCAKRSPISRRPLPTRSSSSASLQSSSARSRKNMPSPAARPSQVQKTSRSTAPRITWKTIPRTSSSLLTDISRRSPKNPCAVTTSKDSRRATALLPNLTVKTSPSLQYLPTKHSFTASRLPTSLPARQARWASSCPRS